ncbi:Gfo/Idh/MocA family oxidoreductase [Uliginosibacterium sp. 31-16]|uniref:Gfo/Idh/MocA family protein n=1 Tax=Uliginosibacterium sp. 31-16 TaxID=3068315 RepID=UPI00273D03FF|nr:Gfo/Idh/MocA family oxidoreductase [Uliginosibacterium sp. 31-16]MDP5241261.1 Gfo/Idh/MocA family oxidoreductase [Uliginosibacterium sp. 31-16]
MTSGKQVIRVGVVGAGTNTRERHIPGLRAQPGVEVVSVVNRSRASSEKAARELGIPNVADNWRALVEDSGIDAVMIGTWPYLHCPITLAALAAGKHVLTEARLAMNATEALQMLQAAQARPDRVAQVVPAPFTLGVDRTVQRLLREGFLGRLLTIEVRVADGKFLDTQAPLSWRQDADLSGLNVMSLGIWYESVMRWVGEADSVMARGRTFVTQRVDTSGRLRAVRVPEHVVVLADMVCGAQATFTVSAVTGLMKSSEIVLCGSEGTLRFADGHLYGARKGDAALQMVPVPAEEAGGWRVEEEFINAIRGIEPVTHTTFADGLKYMQFTDAVARSMAEGRALTV